MLKDQKLSWRPIDARLQVRLISVFSQWIGTPYMAGQRAKGVGVDCVQLVGGILDDLFHYKNPTYIPRLKFDAGIHSARGGMPTVMAIRRGFRSVVVRDFIIEPGDVLVTRATEDQTGPARMGHTMIAGVHPMTAVHAVLHGGVVLTSISRPIIRIYRPLDKNRWL